MTATNPPPDKERQPFRVEARAIVLAFSKKDAATQTRLALHRIGATQIGVGASSWLEGGIRNEA